MNAGWDEKALAAELGDLARAGVELTPIGFSDEELEALLDDGGEQDRDVAEEIPAPPATPVTQPGDVWQIGTHRLICGDCRDLAVVEKLLANVRAAVAITSPPYATQREYDPTSGFKPAPPEEYVEWYRAAAAPRQAELSTLPDRDFLFGSDISPIELQALLRGGTILIVAEWGRLDRPDSDAGRS